MANDSAPKKIRNYKKGPEDIIQRGVVEKLMGQGWLVKVTHGNIFQFGFPDLYVAHRMYGSRWIECKRADGKYSFTPAQQEFFPQFIAAGVGIYIVVDPSEVPDILFKPHNLMKYWLK